MGITRRQFLRWTGVSALGAVIFNGCRIPEEELQVESPVNLPEDLVTGIDNWYATACRQDPGGCGVIIRVVEGRAEEGRGQPRLFPSTGANTAPVAKPACRLSITRIAWRPLCSGPTAATISCPSLGSAPGEILNAGMNSLSDRSRFLLVTEPLRGHLALLASEFVKAYGGRHMAFQSLEQVNLPQGSQGGVRPGQAAGLRHRERELPLLLRSGLPLHLAVTSEVRQRLRRIPPGRQEEGSTLPDRHSLLHDHSQRRQVGSR